MTPDSIAEVQFREPKTEGSLKAYATVLFSNGLTLTGVRVIHGTNGLFTGMPGQPDKNGATDDNGKVKYWDTAYFKGKEDRETFSAVILDRYNKEFGESRPNTNNNPSEENPGGDFLWDA